MAGSRGGIHPCFLRGLPLVWRGRIQAGICFEGQLGVFGGLDGAVLVFLLATRVPGVLQQGSGPMMAAGGLNLSQSLGSGQSEEDTTELGGLVTRSGCQ